MSDFDLGYLDGVDYSTDFRTPTVSTDIPDLGYLDPTISTDGYDWLNLPDNGYTIDLSNSDYYTDDITDTGGTGGFNWGSLSGLLNSGLDLGTAALGLRNLYETNQSNQLDQNTVREMLKSNAQNQERAFTGQAGGFTGDAYTVGMNQQKLNLMMNLMKNDGHLPADVMKMMESSIQGASDPYRAQFDRYAADAVNGRNAAFPDHTYLSTAPLPTAPLPTTPPAQGGLSLVDQPLTSAVQPPGWGMPEGIPEGTDPALIDAYVNYLAQGGA
jgi:hypothetical protein